MKENASLSNLTARDLTRRTFLSVTAAGLVGLMVPRAALALDATAMQSNQLYSLMDPDYLEYTRADGGTWSTYACSEDGSISIVRTSASFDEYAESLSPTSLRSVKTVLIYVGAKIVARLFVEVLNGIIRAVTGYDGVAGVVEEASRRLMNKTYQSSLKFDCDFYPPHSFQWVQCKNGN